MSYLYSSKTNSLQAFPALPIDYSVALTPWFTKEIIRNAFVLLQNNEMTFFSFHRRYGGMILNKTHHVSIQMAKGKGIHRFVFRDGICTQCGWQQGGRNCEHVAALALLCLCKNNNNLQPLADVFSSSSWAVIGKYLHERSTMTGGIQLHFQ